MKRRSFRLPLYEKVVINIVTIRSICMDILKCGVVHDFEWIEIEKQIFIQCSLDWTGIYDSQYKNTKWNLQWDVRETITERSRSPLQIFFCAVFLKRNLYNWHINEQTICQNPRQHIHILFLSYLTHSIAFRFVPYLFRSVIVFASIYSHSM